MKLLFLIFDPKRYPSSRFRVDALLPYFRKAGLLYHCFYFRVMRRQDYRNFALLGYYFRKAIEFARILHQSLLTDIVFLQKRYFKKPCAWLLHLANPKLIYDFDDALFVRMPHVENYRLDKKAFDATLRIAHLVIAGNSYLAEHVKKWNKNVAIIPTSIDPTCYTLAIKPGNFGEKLIIGWIGSPENLPYLTQLESVFVSLFRKYPSLCLKVVSSSPPKFQKVLVKERLIFKRWRVAEEITDIQSFGIGVMPLTDDEWTRGKCGSKALQYMAVGIPAVCSPVGVNSEIIKDGINGFLAETESEWIEKLSLLIENSKLRKELGLAGHRTVEKDYSVEVNARKLLQIFQDVMYGNIHE